jgi:hypothetical protein
MKCDPSSLKYIQTAILPPFIYTVPPDYWSTNQHTEHILYRGQRSCRMLGKQHTEAIYTTVCNTELQCLEGKESLCNLLVSNTPSGVSPETLRSHTNFI